MKPELKPCPFCGGEDIEIQISTPDREGVPTNLMCSDCGASGPWEYEQGNSHAKADDAWNRRSAMQSQDKEDTDRLDWLDKIAHCADWVKGEPTKRVIRAHDGAEFTGDTWREAIDHARRIEGEEK